MKKIKLVSKNENLFIENFSYRAINTGASNTPAIAAPAAPTTPDFAFAFGVDEAAAALLVVVDFKTTVVVDTTGAIVITGVFVPAVI